MCFLNYLTNPPEKSLHIKNRSTLTVNVDDSLVYKARPFSKQLVLCSMKVYR